MRPLHDVGLRLGKFGLDLREVRLQLVDPDLDLHGLATTLDYLIVLARTRVLSAGSDFGDAFLSLPAAVLQPLMRSSPSAISDATPSSLRSDEN